MRVPRTLTHTPKVGRALPLGLVLACGEPVLAHGQFAKSPVFFTLALKNRPFHAFLSGCRTVDGGGKNVLRTFPAGCYFDSTTIILQAVTKSNCLLLGIVKARFTPGQGTRRTQVRLTFRFKAIKTNHKQEGRQPVTDRATLPGLRRNAIRLKGKHGPADLTFSRAVPPVYTGPTQRDYQPIDKR